MKHVGMETQTKHNSDEAQESNATVHQMQRGTRLSHIWAFLWLALRTMIQKMPWKRVPQVSQMSAVECGFACLAMIGIDWTPDEPVPITPTRNPVKSTP